MKKVYLQPWLRVVEIDESDIVCTSNEVTPFRVELDKYNTYTEPEVSPASLDWSGTGTGSDF